MNLAKLHRVSFWFYSNRIFLISKFLELIIFLIYNSRVPSSVKIGKNTKFAYLGIGCVIHKNTIIGENCILGQGITIGGRGKRPGLPIIGNNVYIGAGARILGPITIGDNVIIGPNSVVITNVPNNTIVGGIPAKIIKSGIENINDFI